MTQTPAEERAAELRRHLAEKSLALLPEDTAQRLKSLAQSRGLSMNKLVEQLSAHALAAWDTENHFRAMAATGDMHKALAILDRLDGVDQQAPTH